ncbi:hypothetical protein MKW98_000646 [Papaver atlanticum]|uniref:Uncharacterized protein n=1 Tax=Papaver atlanticum TaxID=357466 RepID=A0AAD4T2G7_9MAGN|nr:hypothetical protein MKW98_000646 [Papaver atlanticum]
MLFVKAQTSSLFDVQIQVQTQITRFVNKWFGAIICSGMLSGRLATLNFMDGIIQEKK